MVVTVTETGRWSRSSGCGVPQGRFSFLCREGAELDVTDAPLGSSSVLHPRGLQLLNVTGATATASTVRRSRTDSAEQTRRQRQRNRCFRPSKNFSTTFFFIPGGIGIAGTGDRVGRRVTDISRRTCGKYEEIIAILQILS